MINPVACYSVQQTRQYGIQVQFPKGSLIEKATSPKGQGDRVTISAAAQNVALQATSSDGNDEGSDSSSERATKGKI